MVVTADKKEENSTRGGSNSLASKSCDNKTNSCKSCVRSASPPTASQAAGTGNFRVAPAGSGGSSGGSGNDVGSKDGNADGS